MNKLNRDLTNGVLVLINMLCGILSIFTESYVMASLNFCTAAFLAFVWIVVIHRESHHEVMEIIKKMQES